uniref:Secreted protein n=1 Tax=Amblyomma parvum TaxID=251391 RepID=A0A023G1P9_AMBPA
MKMQGALGLLLVVVFSTTGSCFEADLGKQVENYFKQKNMPVESWGLTKDYIYWTEKRNTQDEHPITAVLEDWKCKGGKNASRSKFKSSLCRDKFTWNITRSIRGPFPLTVNLSVNVFQNGTQELAIVGLDLTNRTEIVWEPQENNMTEPTATVRQESCRFSAKAMFRGHFAYKLKEARGDTPLHNSARVTNLQNSTAGLKTKKNRLQYLINGTYEHVIICAATKIVAARRNRSQI